MSGQFFVAAFALSETTAEAICKRVGKAWIDKRPEIVAQKARIGDWEGDTVIGKKQQGILVTLAEKKSRYVLVGKLSSKHSRGVTTTINNLLGPHKHKCHTVTFDNGIRICGA